MSAGLIGVENSKKEVFEAQFEQKYFKDLPRINAMKLINFLLKPTDTYETPIVGSFSSNSEKRFGKSDLQRHIKAFW